MRVWKRLNDNAKNYFCVYISFHIIITHLSRAFKSPWWWSRENLKL